MGLDLSLPSLVRSRQGGFGASNSATMSGMRYPNREKDRSMVKERVSTTFST